MHPPRMHSHDVSPLGFTGERVLPDDPDWAWCFQAHKFGYDDLVARIAPGARILDIGCGEGYGAELLAQKGTVVACDYSFEAVKHARDRYRGAAEFLVCDAQKLPFADDAFDVVSSLQVIEHFRDTEAHLAGVARILRADGWHYVATPNIDQMSEEERDNPYHLRDFTARDLRESLTRHFENVDVLGMFYVESSPRVRAMREAEEAEETFRPTLDRIERSVSRLPGPLRVRLRRFLRARAGAPALTAHDAMQAVRAEDFEARAPAEESFCLIGIASGARKSY
ncbi:MAG TPA: methyltransferase domain-containing protein [Actinomycetota bacterium]|nr:methyltransferase domain-containing protein [Actinomycetota bacterium]